MSIQEKPSEFITQDSKPVFCAFSKMFHSRGADALTVAYKELEAQKIRQALIEKEREELRLKQEANKKRKEDRLFEKKPALIQITVIKPSKRKKSSEYL